MYWLVAFFSIACLLTSLLPFVPYPHGIFRIWEFPRTQNLLIAALVLLVSLLFLPFDTTIIFFNTMLGIAIVIQVFHIARFTPLWRRRSENFSGELSQIPTIKLLISNVKMGNRNYDPTLALLAEHDPDIAVFMETDEKWITALQSGTSNYQHQMECPLDNAYGMYMVSKFRFHSNAIRYLLNPEVPSFDTMVEHPGGEQFRLIVVHPEPPLATRDTMGRDAEIAFVGKLVRHDESPVIVTGDLNDVAWSRTTRRFLRMSRLLDPREGRGQFNTFDARFFFLRWPLDHIFHSPHFQLVSMCRLPFTKSDHFPMLYKLALTQKTMGRRRVDAATSVDLDEAAELISIEKERDNRPIGAEWESD